jgi:hypothetical protein
MSPQAIGNSTTHKTRVALEKPCKERKRTLIGQSQDRRVLKELSALAGPTIILSDQALE